MASGQVLDCLANKKINVKSPDGDGTAEKPFLDWFRENVLGLDSEAYRREFWREARSKGYTIGHMPRGLDEYIRERTVFRQDIVALLFGVLCVMGCSLAFWLVRRQLTLILRRLKRSSYYERERGRRLMLADLRRAVTVRRTPNPMPSVDELRAAYARAGDSPEDSLRFGAMLQDLECYVDNHVIVDPATGEVRGRMGGIKRFLEREAPDLYDHYKHVMSHKARAKKFRQACDAVDPVPVDALLPQRAEEGSADAAKTARTVGGTAFPDWDALRDVGRLTTWMSGHGNTGYLKTRRWLRRPVGVYSERSLLRDDSLSLAAEMLAFCDGTLVSLDAAIALKIDPDLVKEDVEPDARVKVLRAGTASPRVPSRLRSWLARRKETRTRQSG